RRQFVCDRFVSCRGQEHGFHFLRAAPCEAYIGVVLTLQLRSETDAVRISDEDDDIGVGRCIPLLPLRDDIVQPVCRRFLGFLGWETTWNVSVELIRSDRERW